MANADYAPHVCWRLPWINLKRNTDIFPCRCNTEYNKRIVVLCCIMYVYYNISNVCLFQTSSIRQKFTASNWHIITRSLLIDEQPMRSLDLYRHIEISFLSRPFPIWSFTTWIDVHTGIWWFTWGGVCVTGVNCHHHTGLNQSLHLLNWIIAPVMFVHWTPDMGIPSMIQPASWI